MTSITHTPGPWIATGCQLWRHGQPPGEDQDEKYLVVDLLPGTGESVTRTEANARLIAAAPTMLEVLKLVHSFKNDETTDHYQEVLEVVSAAIAKAEEQS